MIPTVLPSSLLRVGDVVVLQGDQATGRTLEQRHDALGFAAVTDLGRQVDAIGDAEIGLAGVDQLQGVGGRGRLDDLQVDAVVLVVALLHRLVDPGVNRSRDEVEHKGRVLGAA